MAQDDNAYLERRLNHSLQHANHAADPAVASVHRNFAAQYAAMLHGHEPGPLPRASKSD